MKKLYKSISFILILLAVFFSAYLKAFADFGSSGWTIFRKVQSTQFKGISTTNPHNSNLSGIFYNPAILGALKNRELLLLSELGPVEDSFGGMVYSEPFKNSSLAAGLVYYDAGIAELNWEEDGKSMSRDVHAQRDMMGIVSYGHKLLSNLSAGISLKGAQSELAETETALALAGDIGIFYLPYSNLSLTCAIQNIGKTTKFINKSSPLPTAGYLGSGFALTFKKYRVLYTGGITYFKEDKRSIPEAGIEIGYDMVSLNAGYRFAVEELNLHVGFGVTFKNIMLGYAYVPSLYLNQTHRITLGYTFSSYQPAKKSKKPLIRHKKLTGRKT